MIDWVFAGLITSTLKLHHLTLTFSCSEICIFSVSIKKVLFTVRKGMLGLYSYAMHKDTVTNDAFCVAIGTLLHDLGRSI